MPVALPEGSWALILGGSSGFGLATAHQLSRHGVHLCLVHRDRRGAMPRIQPEFDAIRDRGVSLLTFNDDALSAERRGALLDQLAPALGERGKVRLLLHSIAFGNLKLIAPEAKREETARAALARALGIDEARLGEAVDRLFSEGVDALAGLTAPPEYPAAAFIEEEDLQQTIHAMGTSLLGWVQEVHRRSLFSPDARVVGLTSEGNEVAWKGYAAVAAAKVALESISRAIAVEMAPYGLRSNIVQAGVTDTPALRLIPGNAHLKAAARRRNPFGRLTTPEDVARVIHLLCLPEAAWINGEVIRVDGGEHVSGGVAVSLYLHGLGHFHPENVISNRFLEDLDIGTTDAWILERVGIRARRTLLPLDYIRDTRNRDPRMSSEAQLYGNAETGRRAAEMAIARAGIDRRDIGMVISGSSAPDMVTPADACTIAAALGLEVPCFDVNSACTSFHVAMHLLSMMDPEKVPRFVLSVVPEGVTRTVDYSDRSAAVLWGDGTAAAVLSTREPGRARILGNTLESSPAGHDKVTIPRQGHFLQEGRTVQMFAIKKTVRLYRDLRERFAEAGRRLHFVGHQANLMMLEKVCELGEVPPELHHHNVRDFGNTAGAGSVGVLSMRWDDWTDADDVAVAGVGAGLTWSSFLLRFGTGA